MRDNIFRRMNKAVCCVSLVLFIAAPIFSSDVTRVQYLMGSLCEIQASGENRASLQHAITEAFSEISRLDDILSTYQSDSEITKLNSSRFGKPLVCSPDLFDLLVESQKYFVETNGAFDVTFDSHLHRNPNGIKDRPLITLSKEDRSVAFHQSGVQINFGGIGKGYALDKASDILKRHGVESGMLNFSGQILFVGDDDSPKPVVVSDPLISSTTLHTIYVTSGSVATSSQRVQAGHILDMKTNQPATFQGSVTVVAPTATQADALSTALLVMGPEAGILFLENKFPNTDALFLVPDGAGWSIKATKRLRNSSGIQ